MNNYCSNCGSAIKGATYCPTCGISQFAMPAIAPVSHLSRAGALLLAVLLGMLGAHRFYAGKTGTAVLMIITLGGLGIWVIIDIIMIAMGTFTDSRGYPIVNW